MSLPLDTCCASYVTTSGFSCENSLLTHTISVEIKAKEEGLYTYSYDDWRYNESHYLVHPGKKWAVLLRVQCITRQSIWMHFLGVHFLQQIYNISTVAWFPYCGQTYKAPVCIKRDLRPLVCGTAFLVVLSQSQLSGDELSVRVKSNQFW